MPEPVINLLSPKLIDQNRSLFEQVEKLSNSLWREIGWHYYLDFIWVLSNLRHLGISKGAMIVDAGAGNGLLQYLLAEQGYQVISVDYSKRRYPILASLVFSIKRTKRKNIFNDQYITHLDNVGSFRKKLRRLPIKLFKNKFDFFGYFDLLIKKILGKRKPGMIIQYRTDMRAMDDIATDSIDAVVSVSAIEHMNKETIKDAVREFRRVMKPTGVGLITTSAAKEDFFHEPSKGWCFSEQTLYNMFGIEDDKISSNYSDYDCLFDDIGNCESLRSKLSSLYFASGYNGMPWGVWDPKYLPVGVRIGK